MLENRIKFRYRHTLLALAMAVTLSGCANAGTPRQTDTQADPTPKNTATTQTDMASKLTKEEATQIIESYLETKHTARLLPGSAYIVVKVGTKVPIADNTSDKEMYEELQSHGYIKYKRVGTFPGGGAQYEVTLTDKGSEAFGGTSTSAEHQTSTTQKPSCKIYYGVVYVPVLDEVTKVESIEGGTAAKVHYTYHRTEASALSEMESMKIDVTEKLQRTITMRPLNGSWKIDH